MSMNDDDTDDEEPDAEPFYPGQGPNREGMVSDYLPSENEWSAKTNVDLTDPAAIAALREMGTMFPEVEDLQPVIDEFLHHFLKTKTSIKGASRSEYKEILKAMYGKSDDESSGVAFQMLAGEKDD